MIYRCKVSSVNNNKARVIITDRDNAVSAELPVLYFTFEGVNYQQQLQPGENVLAVFYTDDFSDGAVLGKV